MKSNNYITIAQNNAIYRLQSGFILRKTTEDKIVLTKFGEKDVKVHKSLFISLQRMGAITQVNINTFSWSLTMFGKLVPTNPVGEIHFYCSEKQNVGYYCETQCDQCKKTDNLQLHDPF